MKTLQVLNDNEEPFFLLASDLIQSNQTKYKCSRVVVEIVTKFLYSVMNNTYLSCSHKSAGVTVATMVSD